MQKSTHQHNSAQCKESLDSQPHRGFFAFIPAHVRDARELSPYAKLLYAEISALTHERGYCWASNARFASILNVCTRSIKNWMRELRDHGFIEVQIDRHDFREQRKIWLSLENKEKFRVGTAVPTPQSSRENAPTDNRQGGNGGAHRWERACPLKNTGNNTASKLASHPSDLPSGDHKPEEEDDEDYGFPDPGPEEIPISRKEADSNYHKLRDTYKLCHEDAKFLAIRYRGPEIKAQLNNMERQISQGIKITKPGKWIRGVLEQECGKRAPSSQLKRRES